MFAPATLSIRIRVRRAELNRDGHAPLRAWRARLLPIAEFMTIGRPVALDQVRVNQPITDMFERRLEAIIVECSADVGLELDGLGPRGGHRHVHFLVMELLEHGGDDRRAMRTGATGGNPMTLAAV
jgi:hypothetical protein